LTLATPLVIGFVAYGVLSFSDFKLNQFLAKKVNAKLYGEPLMKDGMLHFIFRLDSTSYRNRYVIWIKKYFPSGGWEFLKFEVQGAMPVRRSVSSLIYSLCSQHEFVPCKGEERNYLRRVRETLYIVESKVETLHQVRNKQEIILVEIDKILKNTSGNKLIGILRDRAKGLKTRLIDQLTGIRLTVENFESERIHIIEYVSVPLQLRKGGTDGLGDINELSDAFDNYKMDRLIEESFLIEQAYNEIDRI
jgi:hypothetical protein